MRILVLTKPVPDPAANAERFGPDLRLDRAASPTVVNGNDEYALEAALQLVEAHEGGEVAILAMAPANAIETMRKALAMGAQRGVLVTDPALEGADLPATVRVLAAAAAQETFDLLLTGLDTSDGTGGAVAAGRRGAARPAAALGGGRHRARSRHGTRPGEAPLREGVRPHRGADAGGHLVHPGAGRATLPVAQGDHGRAPARDRGQVARGPRGGPADGGRRSRARGRRG